MRKLLNSLRICLSRRSRQGCLHHHGLFVREAPETAPLKWSLSPTSRGQISAAQRRIGILIRSRVRCVRRSARRPTLARCDSGRKLVRTRAVKHGFNGRGRHAAGVLGVMRSRFFAPRRGRGARSGGPRAPRDRRLADQPRRCLPAGDADHTCGILIRTAATKTI